MISLTGSADAGDLSALSPWANELAQTFVSLASDIALVVDAGGVIRNVAQRGGDPLAPAAAHWIGQPWADTVTGETRRKVELLNLEGCRDPKASNYRAYFVKDNPAACRR